jgi:hypothetical protein
MTLSIALLIAPLLLVANLSVAGQLAGACEALTPMSTGLVLLCLAVAAGLTVAAWREMRRAEGAAASHERHFVALLATESGALSCLVIVAIWLPSWMLASC